MTMSRRLGIRRSTREDGPRCPLLPGPSGARATKAGELQFGPPNERQWRPHVSSRADPPSGKLPGAGAERRLHAAVLLPAVAVAMADGGLGDVPRARRRRRPIRARGAQPEPGAAAAVGDRTSRLCAAERISGVHAVQSVPPRQIPLRLLRVVARTDLRPCDSARPRWSHDLGECRGGLRPVQSAQGGADAVGSTHAHHARTAPPDELAASGARSRVPTEPSPRQLARLSLLGRRTGGLGLTARVSVPDDSVSRLPSERYAGVESTHARGAGALDEERDGLVATAPNDGVALAQLFRVRLNFELRDVSAISMTGLPAARAAVAMRAGQRRSCNQRGCSHG